MTHEGISYLSALKRFPAGATTTPTACAGPTANNGDRQEPKSAEKRRSPRYKCEGSAEMRQEGATVHTWATFTDVSMHGCYVEATATYPVGTVLEMKLSANGFEVLVRGKVRVSYPCLGM